MKAKSSLIHPLCHLPVAEWVGAVPAYTTQDDLGFVVSPLEGVGLGHRDKSEQARPLTLTSADERFCNTTQSSNQASKLDPIHPNAAGIDIGAQNH